MKKIIFLAAVTISILNASNNVGFLSNQKYICVSQGMIVGDKINPTNQDEAMKYPLRFYVDNNNVLHTDANMVLPHLPNKGKTMYSDGDNVMGLTIKEDKRYLASTNNKLSSLGVSMLYICAETDNWTLAK